MGTVRNAVLSGSWYPDDTPALIQMVDGFLAGGDPAARPAGRPLLGVAPHAGYAYSGPTAGKLFALLADFRPATVLILAPNHRHALAKIALSQADAFATPLGPVPLDGELTARLAACPAFCYSDAAHGSEHAVEIQLPFLQRTWPENVPAIVPLLVPRLSEAQRAQAARTLAAEAGPETLLLVSSDFTHYGVQYGYVPFQNDIPAGLARLDQGAINLILAGDAAGLLEYGLHTGITMCGLEAAALALSCGLPEDFDAGVVDYARSGDRDGDYSLSVSYASLLITEGTS